jgi:hypothetical protein
MIGPSPSWKAPSNLPWMVGLCGVPQGRVWGALVWSSRAGPTHPFRYEGRARKARRKGRGMRRTTGVTIMVVALMLATMAPALAKGPAAARGGPSEIVPYTSAYWCDPIGYDIGDAWPAAAQGLEVRNHATARIIGRYGGTWNAQIVDYRVSYYEWVWQDGEYQLRSEIYSRHQVPASGANVACWFEMEDNPGWDTVVYLRLGNGQFKQWMDAHWPGWDD